jgi:hypothetical protein
MHIKILKPTPYRKGHEKEIKAEEIHKVTRIRRENVLQPVKAYFFLVDGRERMALESDCAELGGN